MSQFRYDIVEDNDIPVLFFYGRINESAELPDLSRFSGQDVICDLEQVTFINSLGIRRWLHWTENLFEIRLVLKNVPSTILDQVNLIKDFLPPQTGFSSFYVPVYCESCDQEDDQLFEQGKEFVWNDEKKVLKEPLQVENCTQCNSQKELNIQPQKFFGFFKTYSR